MSDRPPPYPLPPGTVLVERNGVVSAIATATSATLTTLPGQFLALLLVNIVFIGGMLWFLDREDRARMAFEERTLASRERMILPLLKACGEYGPVKFPDDAGDRR